MSDERLDVQCNLEAADEQKSTDNEIQKSDSPTPTPDQSTVPGPSNAKPTPHIFDCFGAVCDGFQELFERLSLKDLRVLRSTCKRFKELTESHIKKFYPAVKSKYKKIEISTGNLKQIHQLDFSCIKLQPIELCIDFLTDDHIDVIRDILVHEQVEIVRFGGWHIREDLYEVIFQFCPNMKHLSIGELYNQFAPSESIKWLHLRYPRLEHFELDSVYGDSNIIDLQAFFDFNPRIPIFTTTSNFLFQNHRWLRLIGIAFDQLNVKCECDSFFRNDLEFLLDDLHERGFYNRLHIYCKLVLHRNIMHNICSVDALEKLHIGSVKKAIKMRPPPTLKELEFDSDLNMTFDETMASHLNNVERIHFKCARIDSITALIRHAAKVKEILIENLEGGIHIENSVIDLVALNRERGNLVDAVELSIYVEEIVFLKIRSAGMRTECNLVQLKRKEAHEWKHQYEYIYMNRSESE